MLTSKDVTRQSFTTTTMRRGYDEREVDDFLDRVIDTLRYYEQGGRPGPQDSGPPLADSTTLAQRASRWLHGDPQQ